MFQCTLKLLRVCIAEFHFSERKKNMKQAPTCFPFIFTNLFTPILLVLVHFYVRSTERRKKTKPQTISSLNLNKNKTISFSTQPYSKLRYRTLHNFSASKSDELYFEVVEDLGAMDCDALKLINVRPRAD